MKRYIPNLDPHYDRVPKEITEAAHFKRRLQERYGIEINRHRYAELCAAAATWTVVHYQSARATVRAGEIDGVRVLVVFDSKRGRLVTALPRGEGGQP